MGKLRNYYLIARDRKTNDFKVVPVLGEHGSFLEEIDLFTTFFESSDDLTKYLNQMEIIHGDDVDFFIAHSSLENGHKVIWTQELLYQHGSEICPIASNSLGGVIEKSQGDIDRIIHNFCDRMSQDSCFYDMVIYGRTNLYDKFVKYFLNSRYRSIHNIKYQDGGWVSKSYHLIRNMVESLSKSPLQYSNLSDDMYRCLLHKPLLEMMGKDYDENQYSLFDQDIPSIDCSIDDRIPEIMSTFENIPRGTFITKDNSISFSEKTFPHYSDGDLKMLETIPKRLAILIQLLSIHRMYLENSEEKFCHDYSKLIKNDQEAILEYLREHSNQLDSIYQWCLLYNQYRSQFVLGDVDGVEYTKRKENSSIG